MKKYYKYIDVLRVIACLFVLLYHLGLSKGGYLAVCTFFVMSGYFTCKSLFKNEKEPKFSTIVKIFHELGYELEIA